MVHRLTRRRAVAALIGAPLAHLVPIASTAHAQGAYPSKPVRLVVGYAAGGPTDVVARMLATKLQAAMGQPFVVDNKPGAGSNLATELVVSAPPDGHTLLLAAAPITMNGFLFKGLKWDVQRDLEPISLVMSAPSILAVSTQLPAKNLQELVALAKKQPGVLTFGSSGNGGTQHVAGEMFKQRAGIDILHVPYKGAAPALQDLMAGHITMAFMTSVSSVEAIKAGRIRPLAVAAPQRVPQLPDLPTISESGYPGFESDSWNGLFAPKGTPADVIARLHTEVAKALASRDFKERITSQGGVLVGNSPSEFRAFIKQEVASWAQTFQTITVKPE